MQTNELLCRILMSSIPSSNLSPEPLSLEVRVVLHWFILWSTEQRSKFLNHLRGFYVPRSPALELCEKLDLLWTTSESSDTFQCQMQHRGVLTPQSQLLYVVQWLGEFSEIEKDDFLQELLELYAPGQLPVGQVLKRAKFEDRPPSLFQCRMDLLKEWYESWSSEGEKEELLFRISEADSEFFERFDKSRLLPNEEKVVEEFWIRNGSCNGKVDDIASYNGHAAPDSEKKPAEEDNFEQQPMIYAPATYRLEHDQLSNSTSGSCLSNDLQAKLENCSNLFTENTSNEPEVNNASVKEETRESDVEKSLLIPLDIPEWKQSELSQEQNEQIKEAPSKPDSAQDLSTVGGVSVEAAIAEQDGVVVASSQNGSTEQLELQ
ncbi:uncharacterized protein LOC111264153 isoform X1 [Varroa jacobsoni]|uniref:uncharacterized protein LOC111264153 isoform X1 n=2 Tax=Varroa jacobsoni TaxID=62625 RepID=UPI000BF6548E|nr:uncharacterized protein LOC111264153 isoform X1 [Varroa jacobsoni]